MALQEYKILYYKIKNVFFIFIFFISKYYKSITVQCYIASCVSWVPRLTLLDLIGFMNMLLEKS